MEQKSEGWSEWLEKYQLYDAQLSEDANYLRYQKLSKVKLPMVPEDEWGPYLRDLVPLEPALVFGDAFGLASQ